MSPAHMSTNMHGWGMCTAATQFVALNKSHCPRSHRCLQQRKSPLCTNGPALSFTPPHATGRAGQYFAAIPTRRNYANSQFPFTGTSVMLALWPERDYKFEVVVFGGANEDAAKNISMLAGEAV